VLKINEPLVTDIGEPVDNVLGQGNEHVRDIDWRCTGKNRWYYI